MNKLILSFIILISFKVNTLNAQIQNKENKLDVENFIVRDSASYFSEENFMGTFQIIHHSKAREVFSKEIYYEIESKRSDTDVIMWEISRFTTIRIFPRYLIFPPTNFRVNDTEIIQIID